MRHAVVTRDPPNMAVKKITVAKCREVKMDGLIHNSIAVKRQM
jgi:hypothetical protein